MGHKGRISGELEAAFSADNVISFSEGIRNAVVTSTNDKSNTRSQFLLGSSETLGLPSSSLAGRYPTHLIFHVTKI